MFKHAFAWIAAACLLVAAPPQALAQQQLTARAAESMLAEMSAWMGEYYAVSQSSPLDIDGYIAIFDRLNEGKDREDESVAAMEAWRDRALARNGDAQRRAGALRNPPSMAELGARGDNIDTIMRASHEGLRPMLDGQRLLIQNLAELGMEGIRDREALASVRMRAVIQSQLQVLDGAERRIRISMAALTDDHPNQAVFAAALAFYEALGAISRNELAAIDGNGDAQGLAVRLRANVRSMRAEIARAATLASRLRDSARWQHGPDTTNLAAVIVRMLETFPELLANYNQIADAVERAAMKIESGAVVVEAWSDLEEEVEAPLQTIGRMDRERAQMLGQGSPTL